MTTSNEFFDALRKLQQQGQRIALPEDLVIKGFIDTTESFTFTEATPEFEERALGSNTYLVVYPNQISNGDFESDLTGWTEEIGTGITATTQQTTEESKTNFGSLGSLEVEITASTAANPAGRNQDVAASPGEVWNFELWAKGDNFTNARMELYIQWLDAGLSVLDETSTTSTDVGGDFVQLTLENQTAPASTAYVRVRALVRATSIGGTGKAWLDLARAEVGDISLSDRARRIITGECVCRS